MYEPIKTIRQLLMGRLNFHEYIELWRLSHRNLVSWPRKYRLKQCTRAVTAVLPARMEKFLQQASAQQVTLME